MTPKLTDKQIEYLASVLEARRHQLMVGDCIGAVKDYTEIEFLDQLALDLASAQDETLFVSIPRDVARVAHDAAENLCAEWSNANAATGAPVPPHKPALRQLANAIKPQLPPPAKPMPVPSQETLQRMADDEARRRVANGFGDLLNTFR